jgi:hypothetical protein
MSFHRIDLGIYLFIYLINRLHETLLRHSAIELQYNRAMALACF